MKVRTVITLLVAATLSVTTVAQQPADAFDACAQEKNATKRLACFDLQVAARRAAASATTPAAATTVAATTAAAARPGVTAPAATLAAEAGLSAKQLNKLHPERVEAEKVAKQGFDAKVVRVTERSPLISAFELDNGQLWEQTETVNGLWVKPQETITVSQGIMGGFLMKTADGHIVRVHRLK